MNEKESIRSNRIKEEKIRDLNDYIDHMEAKANKLEQNIFDEDDEAYKEDLKSQLNEIELKINKAVDELNKIEKI